MSVAAAARPGLLALALALAASSTLAHAPARRSAAELMDAIMWNRETIGGPFALTDQQGRRRTDADFRGRLMLVYFGFTACADVCPGDLQQIAAALQQLGPAGEAVQPIFITLDPVHDTPARLAQYVPHFHPRLLGLTGTAREIDQVASAYRVYYRTVARPRRAGDAVDHSAFIYLMDREGKYLGFFPPGTPAARLRQVIQPYLGTP